MHSKYIANPFGCLSTAGPPCPPAGRPGNYFFFFACLSFPSTRRPPTLELRPGQEVHLSKGMLRNY